MSYDVALPDGFVVSDDPSRLDLAEVHRFISQHTYWGKGRSIEAFTRAVRHCIAFGVYAPDSSQISFARVLSDRSLRAHLSDVYVVPSFRGRGLGRALVAAVLAHPELATVGTWTLNTADAHGLYAGFGFVRDERPERHMMLIRPDPAG